MALSELLDASDEKYHYIINLTYKTVLAALETGGYEVDYAKFCAKNSAAHGNTANDMESRAILAAVEEFVRAHKLERTDDQKANNQKANNQKANNQKANNQKANNQKANNQKANNQKANNQKANNQKANNQKANNQKANNQWKAVVNDTLKQYGAKLDAHGTIVRGEKTTLVRVESKDCRLYFRGTSGQQQLLMSGPVEPKAVEDFVEKFWFWTKEK